MPVIQEMENKLSTADIELVDVQYQREEGSQILRIFIDSPAGVTLDVCSKATRMLKDMIDQEDIDYDHIEVSSPGLDRILKKDCDFARFNGRTVKVKMRKQYEGPRKYRGILSSFDPESLTLLVDENPVNIPRDLISVVRLDPEF